MAAAVAVNTAGWVMVAVDVLVHPLASVTVTVKLPLHNPVAVTVVWALLHKYE